MLKKKDEEAKVVRINLRNLKMCCLDQSHVFMGIGDQNHSRFACVTFAGDVILVSSTLKSFEEDFLL